MSSSPAGATGACRATPNAAWSFVGHLTRRELCHVVKKIRTEAPSPSLSSKVLREIVLKRFELDLTAFLNVLKRESLDRLGARLGLEAGLDIGELRLQAWRAGCRLELGMHEQDFKVREPTLLRSKLVFLNRGRGRSFSPGSFEKREIESLEAHEPDSIDELLERATSLIGVALRRPGKSGGGNKGALGAAVANLLGLRESGAAEPDWRGQVEVKTVPVARDLKGCWYVVEDPAIAMEGVDPLLKLRKVLWMARVADAKVSFVLGWHFHEWDWDIARWVKRDLHQRPKGPRGATTKGWYLHKRFFTDCGLLAALNG